MKKEKKQSGRSKQRVILIALCVFLALILILLIAAAVVLGNLYGSINRTTEEDNYTLSQEDAQKLEQDQIDEEGETDPDVSVMDENDVIWDADPSTIVGDDDNIVNILLIGQDRRPGEGRARSDSMILCTFNKSAGTITLTSFMRDMYVQIPGYQDTRINAAYALGGMELLDECLRVNFGVHVDANIEVDFDGFEDVIDVLGGVSVSLTSSEAGLLNSSNGWSLVEGTNLLDGAQALAYSRIRKLDSDFNRTNRQRNVLTSVIESCQGLSLDRIWSLVNTIVPLVTTDMTNSEITSYVTELYPILAGATIQTQRIPIDGSYESVYIRGMSVLVPDLEINRQFLIDTLTSDAMEDTEE